MTCLRALDGREVLLDRARPVEGGHVLLPVDPVPDHRALALVVDQEPGRAGGLTSAAGQTNLPEGRGGIPVLAVVLDFEVVAFAAKNVVAHFVSTIGPLSLADAVLVPMRSALIVAMPTMAPAGQASATWANGVTQRSSPYPSLTRLTRVVPFIREHGNTGRLSPEHRKWTIRARLRSTTHLSVAWH